MITEARHCADRHSAKNGPFRIGVTSGLRPLPSWKRDADFLFSQVSFSAPELFDWRASIDFDGPVYAGVIVVAGAPMARQLSRDIAQLAIPSPIIDLLE